MNPGDKTLISFSGRNLVDINFAIAEAKKQKAFRQACNKAKATKKPPPEGDGKFARATQGETLTLRPGTTATVSAEELAFIKSDYPAAFRCVTVHPGVAGKPSRVKRKAAEEKATKEGTPAPAPEPAPAPAPEPAPAPSGGSKGSKGSKGDKGGKATVSTG